MKCQLVGFRHSEYIDKDTGNVTLSCHLYFIRKAKLSESGQVGSVTHHCVVYDDKIKELPDLVENAIYDCDVNTFKGKDYLNDMTKL